MTTESLKLAMTLGAKDQTGGLINKTRNDILKLGQAGDQVKQHFADMTGSFAQAAAGLFVANKLKPGIMAAGDLQESLIGVRTELMGSVDGAAEMAKAMGDIRSTAFDVQSYTPFDQAQIVNLEKELIKAGATVSQVIGKQGAAAAAAALAAYEGLDAVATGENLMAIATPFKVGGDQMMEMANQAASAASASKASFASLAEGAKYASGPMASLGRDTKEMFALLATLDSAGIGGSMGGTSLTAFFRGAVKVKEFKDANGNLKETTELIAILRKRLGNLGEAERLDRLNKMFGDEGARAAIALMTEGDKGYAAMIEEMGKSLSLQEKLNERMKGFKAQLNSLKGTATSTIANLFTPALDPLTQLISKTNEWTGALGKAAQENEGLSAGASYAGLAAMVGGLAVGGYHLAKGTGAGMKMLKALKGVGGDAAGIAKGKAIEAATGVTPVFVTNMPDGGLVGGAADAAADIAGALGGPKVFSKVRTTLALLGGTSLSALPSLGAGAVGYGAAAVGAAGAVGYGAGTLASDFLLTDSGPFGSKLGAALGDAIGESVAYVLSPFSETARSALDAAKRAEALAGGDGTRDAARAAVAMGAGATAGGAVGALGTAGFEFGKLISENFVQGTEFGDAIAEAIAYAMSPFSEEARAAIAAKQVPEKIEAEVGGTIAIKLDSEGRPRVQSIQKTGKVDFDVYNGPAMGP